ncbi:Transcriptional regulator, LuxR family [Pseudomonas orientalis]|nr:Transcriptional regulator, LuxR family [Pseudomonas orientalis]
MGGGLPPIAVCQLAYALPETLQSGASPLPHLICSDLKESIAGQCLDRVQPRRIARRHEAAIKLGISGRHSLLRWMYSTEDSTSF